MSGRPQCLVDGHLYLLGDLVEVDGRISWLPPTAVGSFEPLNCYVLCSGNEALVVDTGVALHAEQVVTQLRRLTDEQGITSLSIFLTRFEPDALSNLGALTREFQLDAVYGGGVHNPFDFFDDLSPQEHLLQVHGLHLERKAPGEQIKVGDGLSLQILKTPLRVLTTYWAYEPSLRCLFTSDSFGHLQLDDRNSDARVANNEVIPGLLGRMREYLSMKFDWVEHSDGPRLRKELEEIFVSHPAAIIAPSHGRVLIGHEMVSEHIDVLLAELPHKPLEEHQYAI